MPTIVKSRMFIHSVMLNSFQHLFNYWQIPKQVRNDEHENLKFDTTLYC